MTPGYSLTLIQNKGANKMKMKKTIITAVAATLFLTGTGFTALAEEEKSQ